MELKSVCITNFKGMKEKKLEFKKGFNLIIGENGTGKTSILEAIAIGLSGFIVDLEDISTRNFSNNEIRCVYEAVGDGSYNRNYELPTEVICEAVFSEDSYPEEVSQNGKPYCWKRAKASTTSTRTSINPKDICAAAKRLVSNSMTVLPVICYQSAGRVWMQKEEKKQNPFAEHYFRTVGYKDCLTEETNIKMLQNWCIKMEHISWQKGQKIAEYEAVKKAVALFMQYMENDDGQYSIFYDRQYETLMFQKHKEVFSISSLSAGYQSLIWMVFDIAYRMAVLNAELRDRLTLDTPGIVLIDELDLHLHPKWQWNIVEALTKVFPKVQFIATTHSPILIAAARHTWLLNITSEKSSWKYDGLDVNETLKIYQDSSELPRDLLEKEEAFYELIEAKQYDAAKEIVENLEERLGTDIPFTINMRVTYELETAVLEE